MVFMVIEWRPYILPTFKEASLIKIFNLIQHKSLLSYASVNNKKLGDDYEFINLL